MNPRRPNRSIPRLRAQRRPASAIRREPHLAALFDWLGMMIRPTRR